MSETIKNARELSLREIAKRIEIVEVLREIEEKVYHENEALVGKDSVALEAHLLISK